MHIDIIIFIFIFIIEIDNSTELFNSCKTVWVIFYFIPCSLDEYNETDY